MDENLSVTLLVKAANQRYDDLPVNCFLDWSIQKLKQHIALCYPSKPEAHHQKLIYSGKLLRDDQILQDILIKADGAETDDRPHTVHLVCSAAVEAREAAERARASNSEGLRYRASAAASDEAAAAAGGPTVDLQQQYVQQWQAAARMNPQMAQMMYYQQAYLQQWHQHMMMYQQLNGPVLPAQPDRQEAAQAEAQPRRPLNQNVQMNAGAGGGDEDLLNDDGDERPRDWLDYVYTLLRLLLLGNIIYFYSSFARFTVVAAGFFLFYAVRGRIRRRERAERRRREEEEARRVAEAEENNNGPDAEAGDLPDGQAEEAQPEPAGLSLQRVFNVSVTFVVTFFSSLLPETPVHE